MRDGVYVANVTPFHDDRDFTLDLEAYRAHVSWLAQHGVTGVVAFGTNGEGPSVATSEKITTLEALAGDDHGLDLVAALMEGNLPDTLRMLASSAAPVPAMSNAVPWSTLVRITGSPTVTLTPASMPRTFTGPCPWSWYIATTRSKSPRPARKKIVSAGNGPTASIPPARAAAIPGATLCSSSP